MTVEWTRFALEDRDRLLATALASAVINEDPQLFLAAEEHDRRIEAEGDALGGVATYRQGPLPDSRLYTTTDGRFVLLYRRDDHKVEIERVWPSRSNWKPPGL